MLLKRKKTKVTSNPNPNDSGISSQGSSQPASQSIHKAFRNPHPAFHRLPHDRPDTVPSRVRSAAKSTPSPRSRAVPRASLTPEKAGRARTPKAKTKALTKRVWQGGDAAVRLRDFEDGGDGRAETGAQSSQQSEERLSQRSAMAELVTLDDFVDGRGGGGDQASARSSSKASGGKRRSGKKGRRRSEPGSELDDLLNGTDSISATADEILDNNADISKICESLENADEICDLVEELPTGRSSRRQGDSQPKTKRRRRLLCLETDSDVSEEAATPVRRPVEKTKKASPKQGGKTKTTKKSDKQIKKERDVYEFRFYSTWVECVRCYKWRLLRHVNDPSTLDADWQCSMQDGKAGRDGCAAPELAWAADVNELAVYTDFCEGSLVWARVPGFPWWPAIVDRDPDNDVYMWLMDYRYPAHYDDDDAPEVGWYHVTFLDDDVSRSWVTVRNIRNFTGVVDMESLRMRNLSSNYERLIHLACRKAEDAKSLDLTARIKKFGFAFRWKNVQNRWTKFQSRGKPKKKKRRSLDQELEDSVANIEALTKQADAIVSELRGIECGIQRRH